jgi:hypothetical protein
MEFKEATDALFERVDHEKLARILGTSIASIRQARLRRDATAYRSPPLNWRAAVIELAEEQERRYKRLSDHLRDETRPKSGANYRQKATESQQLNGNSDVC